MKKLMLCLLILTACGGAGGSKARGPLILRVVFFLDAPGVLFSAQIDEYLAAAKAPFMRDMGIVPDAVEYRVAHVGDLAVDYVSMDDYVARQKARLSAVALWANNNWPECRQAICVGVLPPMEGTYIGGLAYAGCKRQAVVIAQAKSEKPRQSGLALAHELHHGIFGGRHWNTREGYAPNIMDEAAGRYFDDTTIAFLPESVAEAYSCNGVVARHARRCNVLTKRGRRREARRCRKRFDLIF